MNIGAMKEEDYALVERDIRAGVEAADGKVVVKVILENCLLEKEEIKKHVEFAKKPGQISSRFPPVLINRCDRG